MGVIEEPDEQTDEYNFQRIEKNIGRQVDLTTAAVMDSTFSTTDNTGRRLKRKPIKFFIYYRRTTYIQHYRYGLPVIFMSWEKRSRLMKPHK